MYFTEKDNPLASEPPYEKLPSLVIEETQDNESHCPPTFRAESRQGGGGVEGTPIAPGRCDP